MNVESEGKFLLLLLVEGTHMKIIGQKSGFVKNFSVLFTGTVIAQSIPVLLQPLLRRLFDPDMFALFAVYNSISAILIVVASLKYEMAIVIPKKDRDANALVILSLAINLVFSFCCLLVIALFTDGLAAKIQWIPGKQLWMFLLAPAVFLYSAGYTFNYWLIRKKAFRASASNRVGRRLAEGMIQSVGGAAGWQGGLVWGDLFGRLVNLVLAVRQAMKSGFSFSGFQRKDLSAVAIRYKDFPLFQTLPVLLNTLSLMLPVLMVNAYYSTNTTAQFDLCRQVLLLPLALITTAMSQVLLQKFSEQRQHGGSIMRGFLRVSLVTSAAAILVVLFFVLVSRPVFVFLFGIQWGPAGGYAAILAPAFMIQFIVSPVSAATIALEKVRIVAVWQVLYFLSIISLHWFQYLTPEHFFGIYALINVVMYLIYWLIIFFVVLNYERNRPKASNLL